MNCTKKSMKKRFWISTVLLIIFQAVIVLTISSETEALQCQNPTTVTVHTYLLFDNSNHGNQEFIESEHQKVRDILNEKQLKTFTKDHDGDPKTNPCIIFDVVFYELWVNGLQTPNVPMTFAPNVFDLQNEPDNGFEIIEKDGIRHIRIVDTPDLLDFLKKNEPTLNPGDTPYNAPVKKAKNQGQQEEVLVMAYQYMNVVTSGGIIFRCAVEGRIEGSTVGHINWYNPFQDSPLSMTPYADYTGNMVITLPNGVTCTTKDVPYDAGNVNAHEEGHYFLLKGGYNNYDEHEEDVPPPYGTSQTLSDGNVMKTGQEGWKFTPGQTEIIRSVVKPRTRLPPTSTCTWDGIMCSGTCTDPNEACTGRAAGASGICGCCPQICGNRGCVEDSECDDGAVFTTDRCLLHAQCQSGACKKGVCHHTSITGPYT